MVTRLGMDLHAFYGPTARATLTACNLRREASRKPWLEGPARTQPTDQATFASPLVEGV